eukprot:7319096-Pyramimonas_sp.AAC.1
MAAVQSIVNIKQVQVSHHHVCAWDVRAPCKSKPLRMCMQLAATKHIDSTACPHQSSAGHDVDM